MRYKQMPLHPSQVMLFVTSVEDALPPESDVRSFSDVMECLDYSVIERKCSEVGCPPYPPKEMAKILTYAYSKGIRSSRKIEHRLKFDVEFMWLSGGLKPDHNTISRFRKENWRELEVLFKDSVRVSAEAGLVFLNVASTDGSKMESAASKRRIYSKSRVERELAAVERILQEAEDVDAAEDALYGSGTGNELPEDLRDAKARKAKLEEIAKRLAESKKTTTVETDPDSRVMMTKDGKRPCYNVQMSVDKDNQVIVAMKVTQNENDHGELPGMVEQIEENTGVSPDVSLVDCGYADESTLVWARETDHDVLMPLQEHPRDADRNDLFASRCFIVDHDRDVLICPAGRELTGGCQRRYGSGTYRQYGAKGCRSCSFYGECVRGGKGNRRVNVSVVAEERRQMLDRLRTEEGRKLYSLRRETSEPVFGQIKHNRGFDRLVTWGLHGAVAETALACIAHNVMKCAAKVAKSAYLLLSQSALLLSRSLTRQFHPLGLQAV